MIDQCPFCNKTTTTDCNTRLAEANEKIAKLVEFVKDIYDAKDLPGFEVARLHRIGLMAKWLLKQIDELE